MCAVSAGRADDKSRADARGPVKFYIRSHCLWCCNFCVFCPSIAPGVTRQGGLGSGGGAAAGRHPAISTGKRRPARSLNREPACASCGHPMVTTVAFSFSETYCSWQCATDASAVIPGLYYG